MDTANVFLNCIISHYIEVLLYGQSFYSVVETYLQCSCSEIVRALSIFLSLHDIAVAGSSYCSDSTTAIPFFLTVRMQEMKGMLQKRIVPV
jgi:hypothetical protein